MATTFGAPFDRGWLPAADAVARAESEGAAPGTDVPVLGPTAAPARVRARRGPWGATAVAAACFAVATAYGGHAAWLHAKAEVGQHLLMRAWHEARETGAPARPWPWADTHPVARLTAPAHDVDVLVLEGADGRTLAWGPGHVHGTAVPGHRGNAVVTGHRDTHFAFLRHVKPGETILVETANGESRRYRVERTLVADKSALRLPADGRTTLALVTCYPFDAVDPGTPLRYAVVARAE